ncbi:MAG: cupredoxin domain-containing protein [Myxococcales bacterium]|nr:cupredoxin domain-containing protein [Myxococcales bacterium]
MTTTRWMVLGAALAAVPSAALAQDAGAREVEVVVDQGYQPARIEAAPGERLRLRFIRRDYGGCTREVVFPTLSLRRELPTGQPVLIDLPALPPGETPFQCGMNMVRGVVVVRAPAPAPAPAPTPAPAPAAPRPSPRRPR